MVKVGQQGGKERRDGVRGNKSTREGGEKKDKKERLKLEAMVNIKCSWCLMRDERLHIYNNGERKLIIHTHVYGSK